MQKNSSSNVAMLKKHSLVKKILGTGASRNLTEELNRILKEEPELRMPLREMVRTAARYKVDLHRRFGRELERFYAKFLKRCLSDRALSIGEKEALHHLKILLGLSDKTVERIHNQVAQAIYRKSVEQVLSDKRFDARERSFLKSLQQELKLPNRLAQRIYRDEAAELMQRAFLQALSDERLSPDEEQELHAIARSLGATIEYDEKTKAQLEKYRLYWLIENGEIGAIETTIPLRKKEKCYFVGDTAWCELNAASRSARFRRPNQEVTVDLDLESSPDRVERITVPEVTEVDSGKLYLTNRRLIFRGAHRSRTIPLSRIMDFVPMEHGVHIYRKSGKNPFLRFDLGVDVFALLLARVLRDLPR